MLKSGNKIYVGASDNHARIPRIEDAKGRGPACGHSRHEARSENRAASRVRAVSQMDPDRLGLGVVRQCLQDVQAYAVTFG
jgi:hypothetical protein